MALLGRGLLLLALLVAIYGVVVSVKGARGSDERSAALVKSGRYSVFAIAVLTTIAFLLLEAAFVRVDLHFAVVASHASDTTPLIYRLGAPWSSQQGSLLLWAWLLSLWTSLTLWRVGGRLSDVVPWAQAILLGIAGFFLSLTVIWASPFEYLSVAPVSGVGLTPLLQYPTMLIHPPMLYSGYTLFTVPFAFALAALIAGHTGGEWIVLIRRFALAAWLMLGIGIILGSRWSYAELGWGGYWGWDPVENASLMPWVLGTAFLHSVMIWQRREMLRIWSISLILATGILCVLGTFIVRSGVFSSSIHAFGASTVGPQLLILVGLMTVASIYLVSKRRSMLRSTTRIDSLISREAFFVGGNVVLALLCGVILWGTFFPLLGELLTGHQRPLETVWWGRYIAPLGLVLALLTGVGPLLSWRRTTAANAWRQLRVPVAVAAVALVLGLLLGAGGHFAVPIAVALSAFVFGAVGQEIFRGAKSRRVAESESWPVALVRLLGRNRRRYGGYIVHVGIATVILAVAASSAFKDVHHVRAALNKNVKVGPYELRYEGGIGDLKVIKNRVQKIIIGARIGVFQDGKRLRTATPTREYYPAISSRQGPVSRYYLGESTTEVSLDTSLKRDLWMAYQPDGDQLADLIKALDARVAKTKNVADSAFLAAAGIARIYKENERPVALNVIVSPMVTWIWIGTAIIVFGALFALWPRPDHLERRLKATSTKKLALELQELSAKENS